MLVLTCKPDAGHQSVITIGKDVEVTVLEIRESQVRLGQNSDLSLPRRE